MKEEVDAEDVIVEANIVMSMILIFYLMLSHSVHWYNVSMWSVDGRDVVGIAMAKMVKVIRG
jgi:hypothetical protein